jgi:uncharacterized cupredoxin-like copper-binding protein
MTLKKTLPFLVAGAAVFGVAAMIAQNPVPVMAHKDKAVDQTIELILGDFFYQVKGAPKNAPITVKAGQLVRIVMKNPSQLVHEMHIGRKPNPKEQLYEEPLSDFFDSVWLNPGQSAELWIRIPDKPGEWELGCFHEEHYNAGMKTKLIIQPKS